MIRALSLAAAILCLAGTSHAQSQKVVMVCSSPYYGTTTYVIDLAARSVEASNPGGSPSRGVTIRPWSSRFSIDSISDDAIVWHGDSATMTLNRYTGTLASRWNSGDAAPTTPCQRQQKQF